MNVCGSASPSTMPLAQINEAVEAQHRGEVLKAVLTP
jgi:aryl-alcohol dehydrogenase